MCIRDRKYIDRYMMYLHDIRAFVPTIRNFIKFILSTLTTLSLIHI